MASPGVGPNQPLTKVSSGEGDLGRHRPGSSRD